MPAPKPAPADAWLSKAAAASFLGVETRQVERRARQGYIESRRLPRRANETASRVEYSRADLVALKAGTPNVHATAVKPDYCETDEVAQNLRKEETHALAVVRAGAGGGPASKPIPFTGDPLQHFLAGVLQAFPIRREKPWLTLAEAVEYSGLPASFLLACARDGQHSYLAVNVGTGAKEFWRFSRKALATL